MKKYFYFVCYLLCFTALELNAQIALNFDGTDDKVDCGNASAVQITGQAITLEAWVYPTQWKTNAYDGNVICKEDNNSNSGYMLRVGAGGKLNFAIGDGSKAWSEITTGTLMSLNTWYHIAGTYDGSMMRVYIDGSPVDSFKVTTSIANGSVNLLLGAHTTYSRFYQGVIDEVRIWNICRTEKELGAAMNDEFCSIPSGLKAYYKFNQGKPGATNTQNKKVKELTGLNPQGTLTNFALTGNSSNWVKGKVLGKGVVTGKDKFTRCDYYFSPSGKYKWTSSGVYSDTILSYIECDSVLEINLTINKSTSSSITVHACTSFTSPSGLYTWTKSGKYTDYLRNKNNCDSVITINLTVGGSYDTLYPEACYSYKSPTGKHVWNSSGIYFDTTVNYRGCDSIIQVELTIHGTTYSNQNIKACSYYISPAKHVYTKSGNYLDTIANHHGCDSIIATKLNILNSSSLIQLKGCNSVNSPNGKYVWTASGIYFDTISNVSGCDSFITAQVAVNKPSSSDISPKACGSWISPAGKMYTTSAVFQETISNFHGCDSVITVHLTITTIDNTVTLSNKTLTANQSGASYRWLNCADNYTFVGVTTQSFTPPVNGNYAAEITINSCSDTSSCYTVSGVSVGKIRAGSIQIYPNPSQQLFHVLIPNSGKYRLKISELSGREMYSTFIQGGIEKTVDYKGKTGILMIEVFGENGDIYRTLIERI